MSGAAELGQLGSVVTVDSGNVGIGTTNPAAKLNVAQGFLQIGENTDATSRVLKFQNSTTNWNIGPSGSALNLDNNGVVRLTVDSSGNILNVSSGGLGYGTGSGGSVPQTANKSTGVTLSKTSGQITMNAAALAAGATVSFAVSNATVASTDTVIAHVGGTGFGASYTVLVNFVAGASFGIRVTNITGGSLAEAVVINFAVIKAVTA
jgi:hypothetical protein